MVPSRKWNTDILSSINLNSSCAVEMTVAAHDTTGGMETKISEAAMIAKLGIDVYIVEVITLKTFLVIIFSPRSRAHVV